MYKRIFRSVCLTAFAVFIAGLALIMGMLYQYFDGQLKEEIRTEANYLAHATSASRSSGQTAPCCMTANQTRIPWITTASGTR